jgi:argininosuccinate lyase
MDKLWGKGFEKKLDPMILEFSKSIEYDWILFPYLAKLNSSYVKALRKAKILDIKEEKILINGIKKILNEFQNEKLNIDFEFEDVHSFFYSVLRKKVGNIVNKIHAGKSRNDEIATLVRMFLKDILTEQIGSLKKLQETILEKAYKYQDIIIPGFTHLQFAQVILLPHLFLSWIEQAEKNKERLVDLYKRIDTLALGSSALSGTSIPIDREFLAKELQFHKIGNSIDMVSSRDFILEYLGINSIIMLNFSRICEDLIIYFSPGYRFIEFDESYATEEKSRFYRINKGIFFRSNFLL